MAVSNVTREAQKRHFDDKRRRFVETWTTDLDGIVHIPLNLGKEALIDLEDKELASSLHWRLRIHSSKSGKCYVEAKVTNDMREFCKDGTESTSLHRFLMGFPKGMQVDHINGDGLNCRRCNMRVATASQNTSNRKYSNKTGYRGVVKIGPTYSAQIDHLGVHYNLGRRKTALEAAKLYNDEAIKRFGEFAILNEVAA